MGKGKKNSAPAEKPIIATNAANLTKKADTSKDEEMQRVMAGINAMNLDDENFIDTVAFDQSKSILSNSIDELSHYVNLVLKGDFESFPKKETMLAS